MCSEIRSTKQKVDGEEEAEGCAGSSAGSAVYDGFVSPDHRVKEATGDIQ